ncbi:hypothetical protein LCGC14_1390960 [marine sediment metagenome]|uniref:Uncharacterized protein n=1 Tax=marine sediment metagenome TaxID=412755 RepID=A0A0F9K078_9ZZZZ
MKTMQIMYDDLNDKAKKEFSGKFGGPDTFNHEISPLFVYEQEYTDEDMPGTPEGNRRSEGYKWCRKHGWFFLHCDGCMATNSKIH